MTKLIRKVKKLFSIPDILNWLLLFVLNEKGKREGRYYTVHKRPKLASEMRAPVLTFTPMPKVAIVMQGLLLLKDNFTLETVRLYRKYFPEAIIILSTHTGEDEVTLQAVRDLGGVVVQIDKLKNRGFHNVNAQLATSYEGMKKAKELGAEYAIKTRMDQRMYSPNALSFLFELDALYPPNDTTKQTRRLIIPNIGTLKYRIYGIGDMFMFGHIDDMMKYWGGAHDTRTDLTVSETSTILETAKLRITEGYLATEYLQTIGHPLAWTLEDTWDVYAKYCCVFDHSILDIFWYKYDSNTEFRFHYYTRNHAHELLQYPEWLAYYNNHIKRESLPEQILSARDGSSLEDPTTPKFGE
jgi:hypothetical protein